MLAEYASPPVALFERPARDDTFTTAGTFLDPGADTWTATVDYGDGSGAQPLTLGTDRAFALSHRYADDGHYTVTVTVRDDDTGVGTATLIVDVHNIAPTVRVGGGVNLSEGDTFTSAGGFGDPGADTWTATVDYGDGGGAQPLTLGAGKVFALGHTYRQDGRYTVTVRVTVALM